MTETSLGTVQLGNTATINGIFKKADGTISSPSTVLFKTLSPITKTVTTYTYGVDGSVVQNSTGNYSATFLPTEEGTWYVKFVGSGTLSAAMESSIDIFGTQIP